MSDNAVSLSIVIPTYNEAGSIGGLVETIERDVTHPGVEVIVVDDDSPDGTAGVARALGDAHPRLNLRVIVRTADKGLVPSISAGIAAAQGDVVCWLDADGTMPPHYLEQFLARIADGADMVVGSRYAEGGGMKGEMPEQGKTGLRHAWLNTRDSEDDILAILVSRIGNRFANFIIDRRYTDYTSGFYAVRRTVLEQVPLRGYYLDYCIRFLVETTRRGFKVVEVPVVMVPRTTGQSKTSPDIWTLAKLTWKCLLLTVGLSLKRR